MLTQFPAIAKSKVCSRTTLVPFALRSLGVAPSARRCVVGTWGGIHTVTIRALAVSLCTFFESEEVRLPGNDRIFHKSQKSAVGQKIY